jgi:hypothetical protein
MTFRTGRARRHRARSCRKAEAFGCADDPGQLTATNQGINQEIFLTQRKQGERPSAQSSKDFGASRKSPTKHRAKRNNLPTLWTQSFSLLPLC